MIKPRLKEAPNQLVLRLNSFLSRALCAFREVLVHEKLANFVTELLFVIAFACFDFCDQILNSKNRRISRKSTFCRPQLLLTGKWPIQLNVPRRAVAKRARFHRIAFNCLKLFEISLAVTFDSRLFFSNKIVNLKASEL